MVKKVKVKVKIDKLVESWGKSKVTIYSYVKKGIIPKSDNGYWIWPDINITLLSYRERKQSIIQGDLTDERTRKTKIEADHKALDLAQKTGRLIDAEKVKTAAFNKARQVRDALLNIPDRISPILAAESDQGRVAVTLTAEIKTALELLSR
jgi:phage terminase Nu1 subunit (DNA packaging protein)